MKVNQVKAGAVLNYVIIALNTLLGLLYTPYMLRCLGQNEYGLYSLVSSIIAYLTILDFGFGNAIIRYTAKFRAEGKTTEQWEMFGMFVVVYSIIGLIAFCAGMGLYFNVDTLFDRTMTPEDLATARVMMILLVVNLTVTFPFSVFGSIISAYEDFVFQKVIQIARIIISTLVIIALLSVGFKAIALVVVHTVFNIATLLINFFYCRYKLRIKIWFRRFNWKFFKEISVYSFWLFLNAIMDKIYWGTGQFVLGTVSGTIAVAVFSVAIMLEQMYMQFSTAIASVLLPKITGMVAKHSSDKQISDIFIRTGRIQCIVLAFILSGFVVFGKAFIQLWAGEGYDDSFIITLIFFVALFVPLIQNTGITILQARNEMKFRSLLYVGIAIVSLGFQIYLSKMFGAIGCAIAVGGALILGQGIVMNVYYAKWQRLDILKFWREIGKMLCVPVLFTIGGCYAVRYVDLNHLPTLVLSIVVFSCLFIPAFWRLGINAEERQLIASPIIKLIKRR